MKMRNDSDGSCTEGHPRQRSCVRNVVVITVCVCISTAPAFSKELEKADFAVAGLSVNAKVDSSTLFEKWGPPKNTERHIETHRTPQPETSYVYCFDSITVCLNRFGIRWFEFTSTILKTTRGITVGSTADEIRRRYGKPSPEVWLGRADGKDDEVLSYFKHNSTLGVAFFLHKGRVIRIAVGWGST